MNRLSRIFQPLSHVPKNASQKPKTTDLISKSFRLMLDLGIIRYANAGNFHYLPLGVRALEKLKVLVDNEMTNIGAQKVIFPTLTKSELWEQSGRLESATELFRLQDRHNTSYILSPTHEEAAADLLASLVPVSYKQFPLRLYQITSKYRDEIKPRFGLMRGKQFLMKDLYTFDVSEDKARETYGKVCEAYDAIFNRIGVEFVKVAGETGTMGGKTSHEYHYKANIGEDVICRCSKCGYAANSLLCEKDSCAKCGCKMERSTSIEVGHTFLLGDKYSVPLHATYLSDTKESTNLQMGSYGLGLSRILAASLEVLSSEKEMRWPDALAPYTVLIIPPKDGSKEEKQGSDLVDKIYSTLDQVFILKGNILVDDRTQLTIGRRMLDAKRMGYPYIIIVGSKVAEQVPLLEVNDLKNNSRLFLSQAQLLDYFKELFSKV